MSNDSRFHIVKIIKEAIAAESIADLAKKHNVNPYKNGRYNKGWVGTTLDHVAKTKNISAALPDGQDYELKSVNVIWRNNEWVPKETFAITMFNPTHILNENFEDSRVWHKLVRLILVGHSYLNDRKDDAIVRFISPVDVSDAALKQEIESYWNLIKETVKNEKIAAYSSRGTSSGYIQLRTKGSGSSKSKCPFTNQEFNTRAFYATKQFVKYVRGNIN